MWIPPIRAGTALEGRHASQVVRTHWIFVTKMQNGASVEAHHVKESFKFLCKAKSNVSLR